MSDLKKGLKAIAPSPPLRARAGPACKLGCLIFFLDKSDDLII